MTLHLWIIRIKKKPFTFNNRQDLSSRTYMFADLINKEESPKYILHFPMNGTYYNIKNDLSCPIFSHSPIISLKLRHRHIASSQQSTKPFDTL